MRPTPGMVIAGHYTLIEQIGSGGMGVVWLAREETQKCLRAIKFIKAEYQEDPDEILRFQREAQAMVELRDSGVVEVYEYGNSDGLEYIAMEYVRGCTLEDVLRKRTKLHIGRVLDLIEDLSRALAHAHFCGIVHRDIKPSNILVSSSRRETPRLDVKIADFGIALRVGDQRLTSTGLVMGSALYLSPEQASGGSATHSSDMYSLGVVIYECLSGKAPFSGEVAAAVALAHIQSPPPPLSDEIPEKLRFLVMSMLEKDPAKRPHSWVEIFLTTLQVWGDPSSDEPSRPGLGDDSPFHTNNFSEKSLTQGLDSRNLNKEAGTASETRGLVRPAGAHSWETLNQLLDGRYSGKPACKTKEELEARILEINSGSVVLQVLDELGLKIGVNTKPEAFYAYLTIIYGRVCELEVEEFNAERAALLKDESFNDFIDRTQDKYKKVVNTLELEKFLMGRDAVWRKESYAACLKRTHSKFTQAVLEELDNKVIFRHTGLVAGAHSDKVIKLTTRLTAPSESQATKKS